MAGLAAYQEEGEIAKSPLQSPTRNPFAPRNAGPTEPPAMSPGLTPRRAAKRDPAAARKQGASNTKLASKAAGQTTFRQPIAGFSAESTFEGSRGKVLPPMAAQNGAPTAAQSSGITGGIFGAGDSSQQLRPEGRGLGSSAPRETKAATSKAKAEIGAAEAGTTRAANKHSVPPVFQFGSQAKPAAGEDLDLFFWDTSAKHVMGFQFRN